MLISDGEPTTEQSTNTAQVQLGEFYWSYLYEYGRGQNNVQGQKSCITKAHSSMGDSSQSWGPGALCTAYWQLNRSLSLPRSSVGFNFFHAVGCFLHFAVSWSGL